MTRKDIEQVLKVLQKEVKELCGEDVKKFGFLLEDKSEVIFTWQPKEAK